MATYRRVLSTALLLVVSALAAADLCHGWSNSASERAACCSRMANACARVTADECCADKEQRDARQLPPATPQPARDMTAGPLLVAFDPDSAFVVTYHLADARPRVHLLHSVFLI